MVSITSIIVLISLIAFGSSTCDFSTDLCSRSSVSCGTLTSRDTSSQNGNTLTVGSHTYSGSDFNLISFNSLTIANGDIQGRVAVKNNFYGLQGISVADLISDSSVYSLVVGGSLEWGTSGELYPMNAGTMFVGQANPSLPSNLVSRVTGSCPNGQCLDAAFGTLYNYWASFSASIAGQTANVAHSLGNDGTLSLTCQATGSAYFVNIDSSDFNRVVGYTISAGCSSSASWVINIVGSGEVYFGGNSIVATGDIIFNIAGSARRIIVAASINGHVVAPNCDLNMLGGTIYGDVIVSNATIIQVNTPSCPITSSTGSSATGSSATGSSTGASSTATGSSATGASSTESATGSATGASSTESATGSSATGASSTDSVSATTGAETVLTTAAAIGATGGSAIENGNTGVIGSASTSSSVVVIPSLLIMFIASLLF